MNGLLEDIDYPDGGITAKAVFNSLLSEDDTFSPILGRHEIIPVSSGEEYFEEIRSAECKFYNSGHYLFVEDGLPKGFIGIKKNRKCWFRREMLTIQLLFVDKQFEKQGVGRRIVENLKAKAQKIDNLCKHRGRYFNQVISERYFSIAVYPNLFDYEPGKELDLDALMDGTSMHDFTVKEPDSDGDELGYIAADLYMRDQSISDGDFEPRITLPQLKRFYTKMGFTPCAELQFKNPIKNSYCKRELAVGPRCVCNMNRTPLIYPDNTMLVKLVDECIKKYVKQRMDEATHAEFTREVLAKIDSAC